MVCTVQAVISDPGFIFISIDLWRKRKGKGERGTLIGSLLHALHQELNQQHWCKGRRPTNWATLARNLFCFYFNLMPNIRPVICNLVAHQIHLWRLHKNAEAQTAPLKINSGINLESGIESGINQCWALYRMHFSITKSLHHSPFIHSFSQETYVELLLCTRPSVR